MASSRPRLLLLITLTYCILITLTHSKDDRKTYIVYMGDHPKGMEPASLPSLHMTMAQNVLGSDFAPEAVLHSYWKSFNGFVMKLTEEEAKIMEGMDDVVSVFPNKKNQLHTTRSWDFLGFSQQVKRAVLESDIIVGVIDSGIWPESDSFTDHGYGPPPTKWKGICQNFTCNNKIIGARYHRIDGKHAKDDIISPRDTVGHGTHTAATAAGNLVSSANLLGLAPGTARGGVPSARIAVYKACWAVPHDHCSDADVLNAFDEAIADGVDILSVSLGGNKPFPYFKDPIAIGSFHAMKRGILTSNSASNSGPGFYTIPTLPPWLLSVAATAIDRKFVTKVQLGNGMTFEGISVNTFNLKNKFYPLIFAGDAPNIRGGYNTSQASLCLPNSLNKALVKGKIILCLFNFADEERVSFVAAGVIVATPSAKDDAKIYALPAAHISYQDGLLIRSYLTSTTNSSATLFKTNVEKESLAPYVASFSSRGPNPITPDILKPDIAAPGVDILAAWSPISPVADVKGDNRALHYNIISGTSMACPHASAAAAYVKSFHPSWSPSAIKSALMTTAVPLSSALNPEAEFAYGAGQIDPIKALNPGLIYDASESDYVNFLCAQGYDKKKLQAVTGDHSGCSEAKKGRVGDLNLPSFAFQINLSASFSSVYHRTVTNVGSSKSIYKARVIAPPVLGIRVNPRVLSFTSIGQRKSFTLTVEGEINVDITSASLVWDDGKSKVRSPIVVYSNRLVSSAGAEEEAAKT